MKANALFLGTLLGSFLLVGVLTTVSIAGSMTNGLQKVDQVLLESFSSASTAEYLVILQEQADLSSASYLRTKEQKGHFVYDTLRDVSVRTQSALITHLDSLDVAYQTFWIANMILVESDLDTLMAIAERSDVDRIAANPRIQVTLPPNEMTGVLPESLNWNIASVQAELLWSAGIRGEGVVIGGQDTGYEWNHPALINQYRGWDGISADHNYNWHDAIHSGGSAGCPVDSPTPCDDNSHGTHTMGIAVGDGGPGYEIGVAPGARWIGCRNMDQGVGTPATYAECYQWFVAPTDLGGQNPDPALAPDIINNSWSCPVSEGCTDPEILRVVVENVRAAGIVTVHSAGNSGSGCSTINTPAAIYDASLTVGAVDSSGNIAGFSSRGPVTIDGSGRLKPDVSAPGVNIYSSVPNGSYSTKSGTSMAAPHVAGYAALLLSNYPSMRGQPAALEQVIAQAAAPHLTSQICGGISGSTVPNNTYGYGVIDASNPRLVIEPTVSERFSNANDPVTLALQISHTPLVSATHNIYITTTVPSGSAFVSASEPYTLADGRISWVIPVLVEDESLTLTLSVAADPDLGELVFSGFAGSSQEIDQAIIVGSDEIILPRGYFIPFMFLTSSE